MNIQNKQFLNLTLTASNEEIDEISTDSIISEFINKYKNSGCSESITETDIKGNQRFQWYVKVKNNNDTSKAILSLSEKLPLGCVIVG